MLYAKTANSRINFRKLSVAKVDVNRHRGFIDHNL